MNKLARLRVRLFALVLLAIAPGLALALRTAAEERRREMARAHESALELAQVPQFQKAGCAVSMT